MKAENRLAGAAAACHRDLRFAASILPLFKGRLYHVNYKMDCYSGTAP